MQNIMLFLVLALITLTGCEKDNSRKVKYKVTCTGECAVVYRSGIPAFQTNVSGSWSRTLRIPYGEDYFLSATKTSIIGKVTAEVFIDNQLVASEESHLPYSGLVLEGAVPGP